MEIIDNKMQAELKKRSSLKKGISENLAENLKSERARLRKGLGELFANECYKNMFSRNPSSTKFTELDHFFDPTLKELELDDEINIDDLAPFIKEKFLSSYKYPNGALHKLNLKLTDDEVVDIVNKFVDDLCKSRDERIAEGSWSEYIKHKGLLYGAEKKGNKEVQDRLDDIELE